jgi:anti-anti-sigma factor
MSAAHRDAVERAGLTGTELGIAFVPIGLLNSRTTNVERDMKWTVVDLENGLTRLAVSGRMDIEGSLAVDPVFAQVAEEKTKVVADISNLTFLASLGLRTLVRSCKTLAAKGGNLVLLGAQPGVEKVLKTSGVNTIIPVVADMSEAEDILLG